MSAGLRIGFAGTPEFAAVALRALLDAGHHVVLALTQPDRPAGRGLKLQASAVKQLALQHDIPVLQPRSLRLDGKFPDIAQEAQQALSAAKLDVLIVAAYGLILPQWVLDLPTQGCLNIHGSLLPRWRGAAPIHRAIEAGDAETGITIMQMDAGLDTGDMILIGREPIAPTDTTASLHDRLAELGGRLLIQTLAQPDLPRTKQPEDGVCYAHKIEKVEAAIDWALPADVIARRVRAFDPFPGTTFSLGADHIKLWRAQVLDMTDTPHNAAPGTVLLANGGQLHIACGHGVLALLQLQIPGGRRIDTTAFLAQKPLRVGSPLA